MKLRAALQMIGGLLVFWACSGSHAATRVPTSPNAGTLDLQWFAELSRELIWVEGDTGQTVQDKIVRRFTLVCADGDCSFTIVSFPARNCVDRGKLGKMPVDLLEYLGTGLDIDMFGTGILTDNKHEFSVTRPSVDSVLVAFTSHELHHSKNSLLVTVSKGADQTTPDPLTVKVSGVEVYVDGDGVRNFDYRQLPSTTVCLMPMQSHYFGGLH